MRHRFHVPLIAGDLPGPDVAQRDGEPVAPHLRADTGVSDQPLNSSVKFVVAERPRPAAKPFHGDQLRRASVPVLESRRR